METEGNGNRENETVGNGNAGNGHLRVEGDGHLPHRRGGGFLRVKDDGHLPHRGGQTDRHTEVHIEVVPT